MYANIISQSFKVRILRPLVSESFVDVARPSFWRGVFGLKPLYSMGRILDVAGVS